MSLATTKIRATVGDRRYTGDVVMVRAESEGVWATVAFANDFPALPIGDPLAFEVQGPAAVEFEGVVVFQGRIDGGNCCQLLVSAEAIPHLNPRENARDRVRVRPSASEPVVVHWGNVELAVHDISSGGIALLIPAERQRELPGVERMRLSLTLPRGGEALELVGKLIHRRLAGSDVVYGIQFDEAATPGFDLKEPLIREYVMGRQLELTRPAAEGASSR